MTLCINTRIVAWHVLSLFPGELQLRRARHTSIIESINVFASLVPYTKIVFEREISDIDSFWNSEGTIKNRKKNLFVKYRANMRSLEESTENAHRYIEKCEQLMLENDRPMSFLFKFEHGKIVEARQSV